VGSLLIIYSFIVRLQQNCGVHFFSCLVLIELCLEGLMIFGKLEGTIGKSSCFANLEVGSFVFNAVSLARAERKEF